MPSQPSPVNHEQALAHRAEEVRQQALSNEDFMRQVRDGIAALARGERGTPLRELESSSSSEAGA